MRNDSFNSYKKTPAPIHHSKGDDIDELFDEDLEDQDDFDNEPAKPQNSRQRIEDLLEQRRLRDELDDFDDLLMDKNYLYDEDN